ncbi:MAG: RluA family pseudouridine synthase [Candidatus Aminicenantes bacterium]|nr:RluA family pseudouridine synthase [Candidatus Aminicenantes bacterium]
MIKKEFRISDEYGRGERLDVFLSREVREFARAEWQRFIDKNQVWVDGEVRKPSYRLREGDRIVAEFEPPVLAALRPEVIPLEVIHEDADLAVINKPSGLVVHPGAGRRSGTLVNALLHRYPEIEGLGPEDRVGIVHRLDRPTSGVIVVARSPLAYHELKRQFKGREVKKIYLALVQGKMPRAEGTLDWPIGRHVHHGRKYSIVTRKPRVAITDYTVIREYADHSLLEVRPHTGRTHQIRVHLSAAGHPVAGDRTYGSRKTGPEFSRLFLHARRLGFRHPARGEWREFEAPLPEEFEAILAALP